MRLQPLGDQPLLHTRWGRLVGWLRDVALDPPAGRATALEVELAVPPRRRWVAPFPLWRRRRLGAALETDPERWRPIERAYDWIGLDALDGLLVVDADGDWSARVADAEADPETWAITAYLLRRPWWHCLGRPRLVPDRVVSSGPDILVIERRQARSRASPAPSG